MAKKKSSPNKPKKPAKKGRPRATSRSGKNASGNDKKPGRVLPETRVNVSQVDALVAVVQGLNQRLQDFDRRQQAEHQRLEQDRHERDQQASVPSPPSPHDSAFAALPEFMAEMRERMSRIEAGVQQPPRDTRLDTPLGVRQQRVMFAGACKTLGIVQPTPSIIGRMMHDKGIFARDDDKAPRSLLESIYAKPHVPNHLSPEIRSLLEGYGNRDNEIKAESTTAASTIGRQQPDESPGRSSSQVAKRLGTEFDRRFDLIVYTGCGKRDRVQQGGKTNYRRYLTASGRTLFNGWPEWTDPTGGTGMADEQAGTPPALPERVSDDDGATQPAP